MKGRTSRQSEAAREAGREAEFRRNIMRQRWEKDGNAAPLTPSLGEEANVRERKSFPRSLYLLIVIPLAAHLLLYSYWRTYFYNHIFSEPVQIGMLHHRGEGDVELWGLYGDAFDPRAKNVDFDVVVVSATLNPIAILRSEQGAIIVWQQNNLLHSALENIFVDADAFKKAIEEMVISMGQNGKLVRYFLDPKFEFKDDYMLKDLVHVYYWDVPNNGPFHAKTGINAMVAVPIFDPMYMYQELGNVSLLHDRLRDNVFIVIRRTLEQIGDIEDQKSYKVHEVAIPALAGTCCRVDSWMYLDYYTSFFTILSGLEATKIPNPVDRIYLIAYDKLPTFEETTASISALCQVFCYYHMRYWLDNKKFYLQGPVLRDLVWLIPFWLLVIYTHRRWKTLLYPRSRHSFFLETFALASAYSTIAIPVNEILLELAKGNVAILALGDVFFGTVSMLALAWLNNRWAL